MFLALGLAYSPARVGRVSRMAAPTTLNANVDPDLACAIQQYNAPHQHTTNQLLSTAPPVGKVFSCLRSRLLLTVVGRGNTLPRPTLETQAMKGSI